MDQGAEVVPSTCKAINLKGLMAGATGLEPATFGVTGRHSNQLSYAPAAVPQFDLGRMREGGRCTGAPLPCQAVE